MTAAARAERGATSFGRAVRWSYAMDGGRQVVTMLTTFVVAGLVGPSSYGLVALALVYVLFIETILRQGMVSAIVQRQKLTDDHVDSAFWLMLISSGVLMGVSLLLSGWWASVNDLPELRALICVLSVTLPLKGLVVVQEAVLRRTMDFRRLAIRTNIAMISGAAVGIASAVAGLGEWALIAQQVTDAVVGVAVLWAVADWRPHLSMSRRAVRDLLGFSVGSFLASIAVFIGNRADDILTGLFFGPVAIGLYRFAYRLVDTIVDGLSRSLQSVALPELSRLQDRKAEFADRMVSIVTVSGLLVVPVLAVVAVAGPSLLAVIGDNWTAASKALAVLCVVGSLRALNMLSAPMLQALGRPHLLAVYAWVSAVLSTLAFLAAGILLRGSPVADQVMWMALSRLAVYAIFLVLNGALVVRMCSVQTWQLVVALRPAVLASLGGGVSALVARSAAGTVAAGNLAVLLVTGATGVFGAVGVLLVTCPEYRQHFERVRRELPPLRRPPPAHRIRTPQPVGRRRARAAAGPGGSLAGVGGPGQAWPPAARLSVLPDVQPPLDKRAPSRPAGVRPTRWQPAGGTIGASAQGRGRTRLELGRPVPRGVPYAGPDLYVLRRAIAILAAEVHGARLARQRRPDVGDDRQPVAVGPALR